MLNNKITSYIDLEDNITIEISFCVDKDFKTLINNDYYDGYVAISIDDKRVIFWDNIDYFIDNSLRYIQLGCTNELINNDILDTETIIEDIKNEIDRIVELFRIKPELASKSSNVSSKVSSTLSRPAHYGGEDNPFEAIKIIHYYNLNFNLGNIIKYTLRCGKKDEAIKELEKIKQYADFEIQRLNKTIDNER